MTFRARCLFVFVTVGFVAIVFLFPAVVFAQPPELPRVFIDTTLVSPSGNTIAVPAGGDFQAALNTAQPGDVIKLEVNSVCFYFLKHS